MDNNELQIFREHLHRLGFTDISKKDLELGYLLIFDGKKAMDLWKAMPGHKIDERLGETIATLSIIAAMFQYKTIKTFSRVIYVVIKHGVESIRNIEKLPEEERDKLPVLKDISDIVVKERGHMFTRSYKIKKY